ncbi:hypothetical protein EJF36_02835 [Bacillus sp. HMF5848]|uniref:hypothetical protein n=1 Tax=Bacillus sp. HMF5848 TaxID=2495421 RepID=UPI000F7B3F3C|nr:hypothetical protein [Bacillus sp. HMF5848]RSK25913.1 hypothetical protein EJF36_02835 [Bacillus sp. HMF5848]
MLSKHTLQELQEYIDAHLELSVVVMQKLHVSSEKLESIHPDELEQFIHSKRQPTFNQVLLTFIDKKETTDVDIYKKAGIDRRHFSKIRSNPAYKIGKPNAIALALALELNKKETDKLLQAAGYSLSENDTFDLIIQFFIEKNMYDIDTINEALEYFSLKPLGTLKE